MHTELINSFNLICVASGLRWTLDSKLKGFIRRFWLSPYTESEKAWIDEFCTKRKIKAKERLKTLTNHLGSW